MDQIESNPLFSHHAVDDEREAFSLFTEFGVKNQNSKLPVRRVSPLACALSILK